jgi:membrane-anchored glycerophosphoryl diester phosphodiesterase (GDPDase)
VSDSSNAGSGDGMPQRDLGAILDAAFRIYWANANKLIVLVAIVVVPLSLISHLLTGVVFATHGAGLWVATTLVTLLITLITYAILQAALIRGAAQATVGDTVDVEASYKWGLRKFGWVLLVSSATGIMVVIGFVLLIVPGVILLTRFTVAIPALVIEDRKGTDSINRSWNLTKGHFWHVLGTIFVAGLIAGVVSGIISTIGALAGTSWFTDWIFGSIGEIVVAPFSTLVSIVLYLDLRARTEGLTATALRTALREAPPSS